MSYFILGTLLAAAAGKTYYDYNSEKIKKRQRENQFKAKWGNIMKQSDKYDKEKIYTFEVVEAIAKNYGVDAIITIPQGRDLNELQNMIPALEVAYGGNIIIELSEDRKSAYLRFHDTNLPIEEKDEIKLTWYKLMNKDDLRNKFKETYTISKVELKEYGAYIVLKIPPLLSIEGIDKYKDIIEAGFGAKIFYEWHRNKGEILVYIITKELNDTIPFSPIDIGNNRLYVGMTHYFERLFVSMEEHPMVLISGTVGSGKSVGMQLILTNLMATRNDCEYVLIELSDKPDFEPFKNHNDVIYYTDSLYYNERLKMACRAMAYVEKEMERRNIKFKETGTKNISTYNQKCPNDKMKALYVAFDEFSEAMPQDAKDLEKTELYEKIKRIAKQGRSAGIYLIVAVQRPDAMDMLPNVKQVFNVRIAFAQNNKASSGVACDNDDALSLDKREAILIYGKTRKVFKTLYLDDYLIKSLLKKKLDNDHKYLDLDDNGNIKVIEEEKPMTRAEKQKMRSDRYFKAKNEV